MAGSGGNDAAGGARFPAQGVADAGGCGGVTATGRGSADMGVCPADGRRRPSGPPRLLQGADRRRQDAARGCGAGAHETSQRTRPVDSAHEGHLPADEAGAVEPGASVPEDAGLGHRRTGEDAGEGDAVHRIRPRRVPVRHAPYAACGEPAERERIPADVPRLREVSDTLPGRRRRAERPAPAQRTPRPGAGVRQPRTVRRNETAGTSAGAASDGRPGR